MPVQTTLINTMRVRKKFAIPPTILDRQTKVWLHHFFQLEIYSGTLFGWVLADCGPKGIYRFLTPQSAERQMKNYRR